MFYFNSHSDSHIRPILEEADTDTNDKGEMNVFCEDPYEKSYYGFKPFNFTMDESPADESWEIDPIKYEYETAAKRNGAIYDIPTEKKAALKLLDDEIAKHTGVDDNTEAENKLDSTLNWLRKRQTDTIALENRQVCRLYDVDLMADELERLEDHSGKRD